MLSAPGLIDLLRRLYICFITTSPRLHLQEPTDKANISLLQDYTDAQYPPDELLNYSGTDKADSQYHEDHTHKGS